MWRNSKIEIFFLLGPLHSSVSACVKKCKPWPFFLPVRLRKMNVCSPLLVNISVYGGHEAEGFRERAPLASVLIERWYMSPGVQRINIKQRGVQGTLFLPPGAPKSPPPHLHPLSAWVEGNMTYETRSPVAFEPWMTWTHSVVPTGPGPFPGLLDMWGGGGGLIEYRSALLASHGYASLALEYLSPGDLLSAEMEFSYFEVCMKQLMFLCDTTWDPPDPASSGGSTSKPFFGLVFV